MMSMGDGSIQTDYPALGSWREDDGKHVHNTSGFTTAKRGRPAGAANVVAGDAGAAGAGGSASQAVDVTTIVESAGWTRG